MAEHIRHHYIPQCYLNYFGHTKDNSQKKEFFLYAFNTENQRSYNIAVEKACQIKNFYRLTDETIFANSTLNHLTIEKDIFANDIEYHYSILLQSLYQKKEAALSNGKNTISLSCHEKECLAYYIAIQHLRMPQYREQVMNLTHEVYPKIMDVFKHLVAKVENDPEIANINISYKYDESVIHAKTGFLNPAFINPIMLKLLNCDWLFAYSPTKDISTSNMPIVSFSYKDGYPAPIFWKSALVYFPIFPDVLLILLPKGEFNVSDCAFAEIQDFAFISYHNYLTLQSVDIYNYNNRFDKILNDINEKINNEMR